MCMLPFWIATMSIYGQCRGWWCSIDGQARRFVVDGHWSAEKSLLSCLHFFVPVELRFPIVFLIFIRGDMEGKNSWYKLTMAHSLRTSLLWSNWNCNGRSGSSWYSSVSFHHADLAIFTLPFWTWSREALSASMTWLQLQLCEKYRNAGLFLHHVII